MGGVVNCSDGDGCRLKPAAALFTEKNMLRHQCPSCNYDDAHAVIILCACARCYVAGKAGLLHSVCVAVSMLLVCGYVRSVRGYQLMLGGAVADSECNTLLNCSKHLLF